MSEQRKPKKPAVSDRFEVDRWLSQGPYCVTSWPMRRTADGKWFTCYGVSESGQMGMSCVVQTMTREGAELAAASRNREKWENTELWNRIVKAGPPFAQSSGWLKKRGDKWVRDLLRGRMNP